LAKVDIALTMAVSVFTTGSTNSPRIITSASGGTTIPPKRDVYSNLSS
jgi:hypothetical protein